MTPHEMTPCNTRRHGMCRTQAKPKIVRPSLRSVMALYYTLLSMRL